MAIQVDKIWQIRRQENEKRENDERPAFQHDRGRVLHSAAFRCLQGKTQIHAVGENDFYRTRLTHSLEVAQIGSSMVAQMKKISAFQVLAKQLQQDPELLKQELISILPSTALMETICFSHDIGHPPFGHGGEVALNYMMYKDGGFEGNAQTFRILTKLEPYTETMGMNLTRRTLLGIVKYPAFLDEVSPIYDESNRSNDVKTIKISDWKPGKGLCRDDQDVFDWLLEPLSKQDRKLFVSYIKEEKEGKESKKTQYKSLDCSIMELADDIAYAVHDLEDAVVIGVVNEAQWQQTKEELVQTESIWMQQNIEKISQQLFSDQHYERKNAIGELVNFFITRIYWHKVEGFEEPLLSYNAKLPQEAEKVLAILKKFVLDYVIHHVDTQRIEYKGQRMLMEMFQIFASDPERLLPRKVAQKWEQAKDAEKNRVICDYIASMSDAHALRVYQQL